MQYQEYVNLVAVPCCVLSVQRLPDGGCGEIRIVCSNASYKEVMGPGCHDNMPYQELVPQDNKFEDYCYRAAILHQRMHAYVETRALGCWTDQSMIPLTSDREDMGYCQFLFEFTKGRDVDRMVTLPLDICAAIIKACIQLVDTDHFVDSVRHVLSDIRDFSHGGNCRILLLDRSTRSTDIFCEVFGDNTDNPFSGQSIPIPYEIASTWEDVIGVSNGLMVKSEQDMAALEQVNPEWVRNMRAHQVKSLVLMRLRRNQQVFGYLYVVDFDVERAVAVKELLELLSYFLGSEISNFLLMEQLHVLSQYDALTGVMNRNAMIRRLQELNQAQVKRPYGILSVDVNGLKCVNDSRGHTAGDHLLIQAAEILNQVFRKDDLFRSGGDEFVAVSVNIPRETFLGKIAKIRRMEASNQQVRFAIGACWSDGSEDAQVVFSQSDQEMYADKQAFYRRHPELERR